MSKPTSDPFGSRSPFALSRYSLPSLMREVKRDRASAAFAMEKLDQAAINELFADRRQRRARNKK